MEVKIGKNPKAKTVTIINWGNVHFDAVVRKDSKCGSGLTVTDKILKQNGGELRRVINDNSDSAEVKELRDKVRILEKEKIEFTKAKNKMQIQFSKMEDKVREAEEKDVLENVKKNKKTELEKLKENNKTYANVTKNDEKIDAENETNDCGMTVERKCDRCTKSFKTSEVFNNHLCLEDEGDGVGDVHNMDTNEKDESCGDDGYKEFNCEECDFKTDTEMKLKRHHNQKHEDGYEEFNCEECDFQADTERRLKRHQNQKHVEKAMECNLCDDVFQRKHELNRHISMKHPSERICRFFLEDRCKFEDECIFKHERKSLANFKCNICGEVFKLKNEMMMHRKNGHLDRLIPCRNYFKKQCDFDDNECWYRHTVLKKRASEQDFQEVERKRQRA
jgi:hypothetical protein